MDHDQDPFSIRVLLFPNRHLSLSRHDLYCWGLVLNRYESKTRQHKILNDSVLRPMKHYSLGDNELWTKANDNTITKVEFS
jgi:hypothetical protein